MVLSKQFIYLIHAADTTLLESSRESAEQKFKTMLEYCKENQIQIQKCEVIVINGDDEDREPTITVVFSK